MPILFQGGIEVTQDDFTSLLRVVKEPSQWMENLLRDKAKARRQALLIDWRSSAQSDRAVQKILDDARYQTRLQRDHDGHLSMYNITRYEARIKDKATVTLFQRPRSAIAARLEGWPAGVVGGIRISEFDQACILAYVYSLEDWILGALLGKIIHASRF